MSLFEAAIAITLGLISAVVGIFGIKLQSKAADKAEENTANALLTTATGDLLKQYQNDIADLRQRLQATQEQSQRLSGAVSLVPTKADNDYVVGLEHRLDRAWARIDVAEARLEKADKRLDECQAEMDAKIKALEARLK